MDENIKVSEDFEKLSPPKPGDWLYHFPEKGQTFKEYINSVRNKKTKKRNIIYIQPLGKIREHYPDIIEKDKEFLEIFFDSKTVIKNSIPIPKNTFNEQRGQYNADRILSYLSQKIPDDAIAFIGLMAEDIFSGNLNFVFGLGSFTEKVGVYSIVRYKYTYPGQDKSINLLKRTLKVSAHEIGHIFGLEHCIKYKCGMNGSNSLKESDLRPIHFCPLCLRKLEWNIGFDKLIRYKKLEQFYEKVGFDKEASFILRRIKKL